MKKVLAVVGATGWLLVLVVWLEYVVLAQPPIRPGEVVPSGVQYRQVDLHQCGWVDFKNVSFRAEVDKTTGKSDVSIELPGTARCADLKK